MSDPGAESDPTDAHLSFQREWSDQHEAERAIADRLDALEAEQVFARALELEAESLDQPHLFTADQLESIAAEINMDVAFVRQALGEVRMAPSPRSWLDRRILPDSLMETETIEGVDRVELEAAISEWMTEHEGLIASGRLDDGTRWDVDRRLAARFKAMRAAGGNRISRVAGGDVAHRVHTISDDEHVVAMQSRGEGPLLLAKAGLVVAAFLVALGFVGGIGESLVDFLQGAAALLVVGGAVATGAVVGARRWARGIGRALRRSLTGLANRVGAGRDRDPKRRDVAPVAAELMSILTARLRERRNRRRGSARE